MQYPFLPFFAFLAAVLVIIPFPWHWRARNVATMALMFWLCIVNIIFGVNAIVWAGNVNNPIPVWCDISTWSFVSFTKSILNALQTATKIAVGASYALPLATLCICKHLEMVSSSRKVSYDLKDRKRRMIFESVMCFLVPVIFMALRASIPYYFLPHNLNYPHISRLYRARSPFWYHRKLWLPSSCIHFCPSYPNHLVPSASFRCNHSHFRHTGFAQLHPSPPHICGSSSQLQLGTNNQPIPQAHCYGSDRDDLGCRIDCLQPLV